MRKFGVLLHISIIFTTYCCARRFDIENDNDVLVYLHIQKTGGTTFNRHLIKDIEGYRCPQHPEEEKKYYRSICNHSRDRQTYFVTALLYKNKPKPSCEPTLVHRLKII